MRIFDTVVLHCSATPEGRWHDADDLRDWHVNGNGWSDIGYHFVLLLDGTIEEGRPLRRQGAHVKGHNKNTVGVCYIGGVDEHGNPKDTMTPEQEMAFEQVVYCLREEYGDEIDIMGHRDYEGVSKACPSLDVREKFDYLIA